MIGAVTRPAAGGERAQCEADYRHLGVRASAERGREEHRRGTGEQCATD